MRAIFQTPNIWLGGLLWLLAACSKHTETVSIKDAGLAFYNASQVLREELYQTREHSRILLNSIDPYQAPDSASDPDGILMPEFYAPDASFDPQQFFPNYNGNTPTSPPWTRYMRVRPDIQQVAFLAPSDSSLLVQAAVETSVGENSCVYLTDSLGYYQTFKLVDDSDPAPDQVQLTVLHLSPDAGVLICSVNDSTVGAGRSLSYHGSTRITFPAPDINTALLLRVQLAGGADPANVIARKLISVIPGHSYTLIVNGYYDDHSYINPAGGKRADILSDFRLSVMRNK